MKRLALVTLGVLGIISAGSAAPLANGDTPRASVAAPDAPLVDGEKLVYVIKYGPFRGAAELHLSCSDTVRGQTTWQSALRLEGSALGFKMRDRYRSWFTVDSIVSLRYHQEIDEGSYERNRLF